MPETGFGGFAGGRPVGNGGPRRRGGCTMHVMGHFSSSQRSVGPALRQDALGHRTLLQFKTADQAAGLWSCLTGVGG